MSRSTCFSYFFFSFHLQKWRTEGCWASAHLYMRKSPRLYMHGLPCLYNFVHMDMWHVYNGRMYKGGAIMIISHRFSPDCGSFSGSYFQYGGGCRLSGGYC